MKSAHAMFYVYELVDPRDGAVFYVGKGKGARMWQHARDAKRGLVSNEAKTRRILDIMESGHEPIARQVAEYEIEADVFEHEIELIATLPGLTNIRAGGQGMALAPEEAARRAEARKQRVKAQKSAVTRQWLRNWLAWVDSLAAGVTFPNLRDGDAKAAEFVRVVREMVAA